MKLSYMSLAVAQVALLIPNILHAQAGAAVTQPNVRTPLQVLNRSAQMIGPYDQTLKLRLVFGLKPPKAEEEKAFLEALYAPGSPEYHHFLTAQEWNSRFSPSAADEQAVVDWAASQGLTVTQRYPNRLIVDVEAPVAQIQKAVGVNINRYQLNGAAVFSNDRDPVIPPALSGVVMSVLGLNNIQVMHPHSKSVKEQIHPDYTPGPTAALAAEGRADGDHGKLLALKAAKRNGLSPAITGGAYDPTDIYSSNAYDFDGLYNLGHCCNPNHTPGGSPPETSIAIATVGTQKLSDMVGFHNQYPYLAYNITYFNINGTPTAPDGEGTMDAEWSTAMSNSFASSNDTAHVYVYQGADNSHATFLDIYNSMLTDGHARTMTVSWGCAEVVCATPQFMDTENAVLSAMSGQGWTLVADADDKGSSADCAHATVQFPASSPNVIAAGGTELHLNSDSTYNSEIAWTGATFPGACSDNAGGGGGGFSSYYGVPVYQAFLGYGVRTLPDISLNANRAQAVYIDGVLSGAGGTSIVAPELAGFFAQENAYLLFLQTGGLRCFGNQACAPIGNANYYIYSEQQHAPGYAPHYPFYDITSGCNSNDISINSPFVPFYCATPGYDLATGLGSANMLQLAWAINFSAAGDFGPPNVTFTGPPVNSWHNTEQFVNMSFFDTTQTVRQATGVAGFSLGWDADPAPESISEITPGTNDAFYDGPAFPGQLRGALALSTAGQGCHTAEAKAWDNTGTSSGVLSYGPVCYDTVAPVTSAALSGTGGGNVYTSAVKLTLSATDKNSGVASVNYSLNGKLYLVYGAPVTFSAPGAYTIYYYSGDKAGNAEATRSLAFTIKSSTTTTKVTSSVNPSTYGLNVTFAAKVTQTFGGVPSGTVTFRDGAAVLGSAPLNNGQAVFASKTLNAGSHAITAVYSGSDVASTSPVLTEVVNKATSTITVTSSVNPSIWGKAITFTASIVALHGGPVSGTVTFKDGAATLGSGTVNTVTNKAAFTTLALSAGAHAIMALYGGSSNDAASTSAVLTETVNKSVTNTTLASSLNPSIYGKAVTFTATVVPASGAPASGNVTFRDGATTLGSAAVNTSTHKAAFTTASIFAGSHSVTAVYSGSGSDGASTSAALTETVNKAGTTTTLVSSLNPATYGRPVTFTATVVGASGPAASGTVTFRDGAATLGIVAINTSTHQATFATAGMLAGSHSVTALYSGNANDVASTSAALTETVNKAVTTTTLVSSLNPATHGTLVTFTATVTPAFGGLLGGTVIFKNGTTTLGSGVVNPSTHKATFATAALTVGTHPITAGYAGNANLNPSTSAALNEVTK